MAHLVELLNPSFNPGLMEAGWWRWLEMGGDGRVGVVWGAGVGVVGVGWREEGLREA